MIFKGPFQPTPCCESVLQMFWDGLGSVIQMCWDIHLPGQFCILDLSENAAKKGAVGIDFVFTFSYQQSISLPKILSF